MIAGEAGMFTQLHHALRTAWGIRIQLPPPFYAEITLWRHIVASLAARPKHLREIRPPPPPPPHMDLGNENLPYRHGRNLLHPLRLMASVVAII